MINRFAVVFLLLFIATRAESQWVQQGSKLVGTGNAGAADQGTSVSISSDGNTAIVGGRFDNVHMGASWIFVRNNGVWNQQGPKLVGTGGVGTSINQGVSVSISADGNTAIVGGLNDNSGLGAVWVFTRSGGSWTQQGPKLVGTGAAGAFSGQGSSVSISADGNTALMGGYADDTYKGAAWIFTRTGGVWSQQGSKMVGTGAVGNAAQGFSVSISADGTTAVVGGSSDDNNRGAAWIFVRSGNAWTQQGSKLIGTNVLVNGGPPLSVSVSADGNTMLLGRGGNSGGVWVFTRNAGVWTQQGPKLVGTGAVGDAGQGCSVSISADGNTAIVGGSRDNSNQGAAWVFARMGEVWTQQGSKLFGTGVAFGSQQGASVAISSDASTTIVGGPSDNIRQGAAWIFIRGIEITSPQAGERWIAGEQDTIRWVGRTPGAQVVVDYSTDSGQTYTNIAAPVSIFADSLIWQSPSNLLSTRAKVRVRTVTVPADTAVSDTFKIKGDVLTRIRPNGHYEAFSPRKHGWSYLNGTLWPQAWWSQFRYRTANDPWTGSTYPSFFHAVSDSSFVDWPLWVDVFGPNACYYSRFLGIYKGDAQERWRLRTKRHGGSCFGFAASSFLAFSYPNQFFARHPGIPSGIDVFTIPLSDSTLKSINRYYTYQLGQQSLDNDVPGQAKSPRTTLQEIRRMFRGDTVDIRTITIYNNSGGGGGAHTMAPISVTVDGSGPSRYRVNLYDSNNPGVDTPYVLVDSLSNTWRAVRTRLPASWQGTSHFYLEIPISNYFNTPVMGRPSSGYSPKGLNNIECFNTPNADIMYTASNGNRIGLVNGVVTNELQNGIAIFIKDGSESNPIGYYVPDDSYSVTLNNVRDTSEGVHMAVYRDDVVYAYERGTVDSTQTDRFRIADGFSVASPDTTQKQISLNVIARLDSSERIFFIRNTQLRQNDSLFAREVSQSNLVLKNYGTAKTYDLEINERSAQEQEVFVHPLLSLQANSSHTIVPNWPDLNGSPLQIFVDLGNNGTIDDTLIVNNTVDVDDRGDLGVPREYHLAQNYPNPFNPTTRIEYALPHASHVKLTVYNVLGQLVSTLVDEQRPAGRFAAVWDGTGMNGGKVGSGVYFYTMIARPVTGAEAFRRTGKMLLLK